jgi:hypothetical protein
VTGVHDVGTHECRSCGTELPGDFGGPCPSCGYATERTEKHVDEVLDEMASEVTPPGSSRPEVEFSDVCEAVARTAARLHDDRLLDALDALNRSQPVRAEALLRAHLSMEEGRELLHGHVIEGAECAARGCELGAPTAEMPADGVRREWLERTAEATACPAPFEAVEVCRPAYEECPVCGSEAGFRTHCECGWPLD